MIFQLSNTSPYNQRIQWATPRRRLRNDLRHRDFLALFPRGIPSGIIEEKVR